MKTRTVKIGDLTITGKLIKETDRYDYYSDGTYLFRFDKVTRSIQWPHK